MLSDILILNGQFNLVLNEQFFQHSLLYLFEAYDFTFPSHDKFKLILFLFYP